MPYTEDSEAGFSMVEVLVALALASFLLIAVGSIIRFTGHLTERIESTDHILSTLLELQGIANLVAASAVEWRATSSSPQASSVTFGERLDPANLLEIRLVRNGQGDAVEVIYKGQTSTINLAAFSATSLEAFIIGEKPPHWVNLDEVGPATPAMLRLSATGLHRTWRPALWGLGWNPR